MTETTKPATLEEIRKADRTGICPRCGEPIFLRSDMKKEEIYQYCHECRFEFTMKRFGKLELIETLEAKVRERINTLETQREYAGWHSGIYELEKVLVLLVETKESQ